MKQTCLLGLMIVAGVARGSFDLMLLPGNDARVYRYDPINNVNLGSYATTFNNNLIAADTRGLSYSSGTSTHVSVHRYSTGVQQGLLSMAGVSRAIDLVGDYVYQLSNVGSLRRTHILSGVSNSMLLDSIATWTSMAHFGDRIHIVGLNASNQISVQTINLATFSSEGITSTTTTATAGSFIGKAASVQNNLLNTRAMGFTYRDGATISIGRIPLDAAGQISGSMGTSIVSNFSSSNSMPAVVAGHNGFWLYGQDAVTVTNARLNRYDLLTTALIASTSTTFAAQGGFADDATMHPGIIVAPEPAAFLPLGLGVLLMKRRRKR